MQDRAHFWHGLPRKVVEAQPGTVSPSIPVEPLLDVAVLLGIRARPYMISGSAGTSASLIAAASPRYRPYETCWGMREKITVRPCLCAHRPDSAAPFPCPIRRAPAAEGAEESRVRAMKGTHVRARAEASSNTKKADRRMQRTTALKFCEVIQRMFVCRGGLLHADPQERTKTSTASSDCRPRPHSCSPGPV